MVWILNCSFKFSTSTLEFYSWIPYFTLFLLEFTSLENVFNTFRFWTQLFYMTLFVVHFQLDKQIFIHCYFLLVLMPDEPALYIWQRCQFCIRYSLAPFRQSPHQISNPTSYIFHSTFEFLFTHQWSLVETKEAFVGMGDGNLSTSSPGSLSY